MKRVLFLYVLSIFATYCNFQSTNQTKKGTINSTVKLWQAVMLIRFCLSGSGHALRNHRGLLGPRGRGSPIGRMRRGTHWPNAAPSPHHWPWGDCHCCHHGDQCGPPPERVQLMIGQTAKTGWACRNTDPHEGINSRPWLVGLVFCSVLFCFFLSSVFVFFLFFPLSVGRYLRSGNTLCPLHHINLYSPHFDMCAWGF